MQSKQQRTNAEQAFRRAAVLAEEGRYAEAVSDLRKAGDIFRRLDATGHPFNVTLENGVSGFANVLLLLGKCHLQKGNLPAAIEAFETSMINARFERVLPYRSFRKTVEEYLADCYERLLAQTSNDALPPPDQQPPIDLSYRFPFSLPVERIPFARLYELAPQRFPHYRVFYEQSRSKDFALRRAGRKADDATMRTISIGVWSVLVAIWLVYVIVVVRSLVHP